MLRSGSGGLQALGAGFWRCCLLGALLLLALGARAQSAPVVVLRVQDAIGPASADYIVRGIEQAQRSGAPLVVLQLDTPGGLDASMRQIIQAVLAAPLPVVTYVSPEGARAASAGTYILYASHVAAMAPSTTLGAATPVAIGPGGPAGGASGAAPDAMTRKQVHDAAAFIRGLAEKRGRNAEWAERAVREAVSLTATEALAQRVIDVVARDVPDLLERIDGRRVLLPSGEVTLKTRGLAHEVQPPGWRHRLLAAIANPSLALVLMMIGIYGLIFEFGSPGFGVAGVTGAICLLLALFALQMLPVNYAGLALLVLGIALMAAEAVTPTFGVLGVGGLVAFVAGGVMLFDGDAPEVRVPLALLAVLALATAGVIAVVARMALRARRRPVETGRAWMIGAPARVIEVTPAGAWALVHGERWQVRADGPLRPGQVLRVVAIDDLLLTLSPAIDAAAPLPPPPLSHQG